MSYQQIIIAINAMISMSAMAQDLAIEADRDDLGSPWSASISATVSETPINPSDAAFKREARGSVVGRYRIADTFRKLPEGTTLSAGLTFEDDLTIEDDRPDLTSLVLVMGGLNYRLDGQKLLLAIKPSLSFNLNEDDRYYDSLIGSAAGETALLFTVVDGFLGNSSLSFGPRYRYVKVFSEYDAGRGGQFVVDQQQEIGIFGALKVFRDFALTIKADNLTVWRADGNRDFDKYVGSVLLAYKPKKGIYGLVSWSQADRTFDYNGTTSNINLTNADSSVIAATVGYTF